MVTVTVEPVDLDIVVDLGQPTMLVLVTPWLFSVGAPPSGETLEWRTDVLPGYTGEQRIALRDAPRQSFNYSHLLTPHEFATAKNYVRQRRYASVPAWFEHIKYVGTLAAVDTTITFDTTNADYREGGALVVFESSDKAVVVLIDTVTPTGVTLATALGQEFVNPLIAPVRHGRIVDGLKITRPPGSMVDCSIQFQATDNADLAADIGYPQYRSLDVLNELTIVLANIAENIILPTELFDSGMGVIVAEPVIDYAEFGQTVSFMEQGKAALWRRRQWLHSLKGKQKPFWLPSFKRDDLTLLEDIDSSETVLSVQHIGPASYLVGQHVMIKTEAGTEYFREITASVDGAANETDITISSSLGVAVAAADVNTFCFMSQVRLDADRIEIKYKTVDIATIVIPAVETSSEFTLTQKVIPEYPEIDPYWAYTILQAHFTGTDGQQSATNESLYYHPLIFGNLADIQDNKLKLYGDWGADFSQNSYVYSKTDSASEIDETFVKETKTTTNHFRLEGDFCHELFGVEFNDITSIQRLITHWNASTISQHGDPGWMWYFGSNSLLLLAYNHPWIYSDPYGANLASGAGSFSPTQNQPYDLAIRRFGSTVRFCVDGVMVGNSGTWGGISNNTRAPLAIGLSSIAGGYPNPPYLTLDHQNFDGRIAAVRMTNFDRYGNNDNYDVPSLPLTTSELS